MTSQDFNVGDQVLATGNQDGVRFDNTPCTILYVEKGTFRLEFDRIDAISDLWPNDSSRRMTWYVYHPHKVRVQKMTEYDPSQQPYEDSDI